MQIILIGTIAVCTGWVIFVTRDATRVMLYFLGAVSLASIASLTWQHFFGLIPVFVSQIIITVGFLGTVAFFRTNRERTAPRADFGIILPLSSAVIGGVLLIARLVTVRENPIFFAGAGRIAYAEDNAKWLNFAANLAQDNPLHFQAGTAGGLAVLLVIAGSVAWLLSVVFLGGVNEAGISIGAVLGLHAAVLVIAPLSLSPIVTKYSSLRRDGSKTTGDNASLPLVAGLIISVFFLVAAMGAIATFGHLSLAVVMVQLVFWLTFMLYLWENKRDLFLVTIIGASAGLVWLPLPPLALAMLLAAAALAMLRWRKSGDKSDSWTAVAIVVVGIVIMWLAVPEIRYLSARTLPSTSTEIVVAEGGTMKANNFELVILLVALTGVTFYLWSIRSQLKPSMIWRGYPLVLIAGFSVAVFGYDYLVAPDGWPHYGARKLGYLTVVLCSTALLPLALQGFHRAAARKNSLVYLFGAVVVVALMLSQTLTQAGTNTFKRSAWTNYDVRRIDNKPQEEFWVKRVNPPNQIQDSVASYPIACVQVENGKIKPGINDAYFCTRFLLSLHASESAGSALFTPLLAAPNEDGIAFMESLPNELSDLLVLVIDSEGNVTGEISVKDYIDLYSKQSPRAYATS